MEEGYLVFNNTIQCDLFPNKGKIKSDNPEVFRPIHYLGSKLRMLDTIGEVIREADPKGKSCCDLFSGSGTVSKYLSQYRSVTCVDIQEYSRVICSSLLNPVYIPFSDNFRKECESSEILLMLYDVFNPIVEYESFCMDKAKQGDLEPLCEFIDKSSIILYEYGINDAISSYLNKALNSTITNIHSANLIDNPRALITRYYGGRYFSFKQAVHIDAILESIFNRSSQFRDTLLAALLSTVSNAVNTVGKQFAQPIKPRHADGTPKRNLSHKIEKDRSINILDQYSSWLRVYNSIDEPKFDHKVLKMDYSKALDELDDSIKVIYADPPYTRDHYSRYYHVLETICLRDMPTISKVKINGKEMFSRGLYREKRHQSPFCIKSLAPKAFKILFEKASYTGRSLVLSYSPFDKNSKARSRVMTIDKLMDIAVKYYKNIYTKSPGIFSHSKFNVSSKNYEKKTDGETLLVFKN